MFRLDLKILKLLLTFLSEFTVPVHSGEEDVEKIDLFRILRREGLFTMPRSRSLRKAGEMVYSSL